jgi:hypothetical protein
MLLPFGVEFWLEFGWAKPKRQLGKKISRASREKFQIFAPEARMFVWHPAEKIQRVPSMPNVKYI